MDKKEILDKARREDDDEGVKNAQNKGRLWGVSAFLLLYVIVSVFNMINNKSNDFATMFFTAYIAAESIPEYIFTKKKIYLFAAIILGIATVISLIKYLTGKM